MKNPMSSAEKDSNPEPAGLNLGDIYYALFRHSRKILLCSAAGLSAAISLFLITSPPYKSEAKILVRYILENKSLNPGARDSQVTSPDARGENIINSEMEILGSFDLARQVAELIGPDKILPNAGSGTNQLNRAALFIAKHLLLEAPKKGNIIRIVFQHPNPEIVQPVLTQLINGYHKKHVEIHQSVGTLDDFLLQQTDQIRARLAESESHLRALKTNAGIISLEDTKKAYTDQISKTREELFAAEAELEERKAAVKELEKLLPAKTEASAAEFGAVLDKVNEYKGLCSQLDSYWKKQREMLVQYTKENPLVMRIEEQIAETEKRKRKMEQENPNLANFEIPSSGTNSLPADPAAQTSRIRALDAKMKVLSSQLERIRTEAAGVDQAESLMTGWQRKKEVEESNLRYYSASLEQAHINEALEAGRISNINTVQAPSPPIRDLSALIKLLAGILAGGFFGGIALAFLIELFLDQSIKRPIEVETKLRLPLFLSIPDTAWKGLWLLPKFARNGHPRSAGRSQEMTVPSTAGGLKNGKAEIAPWDSNHALRPFHEALRDRLIAYFEVKNMTHKPKLVAVASCSQGSGVTTIAAGLAASLSETGDGNVLLVDMGLEQGAARQFRQGRPGCALPDVLENEKRNAGLVHEHLYLASATAIAEKLPRMLPRKFTHLVPKMKASDYDYIIFDLPPINQTSLTARLAGFMDLFFLVVESEKTNREVVRRATALLSDSKANVTAILNKSRAYVPPSLHPEL
jgi:uncharacterized protein involved in exopolysaccharide biosynthesis/Mrp family chromosome partitioning ATPase